MPLGLNLALNKNPTDTNFTIYYIERGFGLVQHLNKVSAARHLFSFISATFRLELEVLTLDFLSPHFEVRYFYEPSQ